MKDTRYKNIITNPTDIDKYIQDFGFHDFRIIELKYDSKTNEASFFMQDTWPSTKKEYELWLFEISGIKHFDYDSGDGEFDIVDIGLEDNILSAGGHLGNGLSIEAEHFELGIPTLTQHTQAQQ